MALSASRQPPAPGAIDWSQIWYPGPTRQFSADELARAGNDPPSRTVQLVVAVNLLLTLVMLAQLLPASLRSLMAALLLPLLALGVAGAHHLWRRPHRKALALWTAAGVIAALALIMAALEWSASPRGDPVRAWVFGVGMGSMLLVTLGWWFIAVLRAGQIDGRLREQAEQQRALDMARQLAAAQIQPHFLFNSLASLQHWVQAKDDRAAPMLAALSNFLRATLPLFNRERLALGDEAVAVREYLTVMALRLGGRLRWSMDLPDNMARAQVPPGLLLTLVENAVEHAVMPSLAGADLQLRAGAQGGRCWVELQDNGPGLAPDAADGVGLANTRHRLRQAFGPDALLSLGNLPAGGCLARLEWPAEQTLSRNGPTTTPLAAPNPELKP